MKAETNMENNIEIKNIREKTPTLYIVIPCYNEEEVLPITSKQFLAKIQQLVTEEKITDDSRILFVNDGSKDSTWDIIRKLSAEDLHYIGICQSRNRGHQNAVLAGLMEAKVVYGVRSKRDTDTVFKRFTAEGFYKLLNWMGAEVVYNHADYRLISSRVLQEFANYKEVNIFLRGMVPLVGFKSTSVYYERAERIAGESHYPLKKMLALAFDGITSLSVKPIRLITSFGLLVASLSFIGILWAVIGALVGETAPGWASVTCIVCFIGGIQMLFLGVIGEYIGKIYLETKHRPRYIISERTYKDTDAKQDMGTDKK